MMPKFCEFSKRAEDGPSRAGGLTKTFPEFTHMFSVYRAAIQNRGQAFLWDSDIIKGWLGMWDALEQLAVSGS